MPRDHPIGRALGALDRTHAAGLAYPEQRPPTWCRTVAGPMLPQPDNRAGATAEGPGCVRAPHLTVMPSAVQAAGDYFFFPPTRPRNIRAANATHSAHAPAAISVTTRPTSSITVIDAAANPIAR